MTTRTIIGTPSNQPIRYLGMICLLYQSISLGNSSPLQRATRFASLPPGAPDSGLCWKINQSTAGSLYARARSLAMNEDKPRVGGWRVPRRAELLALASP